MTISVTLQYFTRQMEATSYVNFIGWKVVKIVNSSVKIHSLSPSHVWKLSSFFLQWKAVSVYSQLNWRTWPQSKGKTPCSFDGAFLPTVFRVVEKLCERNYWNLTKIRRRNEAKIYKEKEFLSSEGHLFNFSWLLPDSITLFCTQLPFIALNLGLIDMFLTNQNAEIVTCMLLHQ